MPDITMCRGEGCPVRESCHRYISKPAETQRFFMETPGKYGDPVDGLFGKQAEWECEYRIEVRDDPRR